MDQSARDAALRSRLFPPRAGIPSVRSRLDSHVVPARGPITLAGVGLDLHTMLLGLTMTTLGFGSILCATLARVYHDFEPEESRRIAELVNYERGIIAACGLSTAGLALDGALLMEWLRHGLLLSHVSHAAVIGLLALLLGFQTFMFTLALHMIRLRQTGGAKS